jgi:signal transduction histidine kinase
MEPHSYLSNDVAVVIKRHVHDVRNALNGMELELTLLSEGAPESTAREAVKRLREAGGEIGRLMQGLSSKYGMESPCIITAVQIAEQWNLDARQVVFGAPVQWNIQLGSENVCVEAGLVRSLLKDALEMAARIGGRRSLQVNCRCEGGRICFEISTNERNTGVGIIDSQQAYWTALGRLAKRGQILMRPEMLSPNGSFPIQLSLPLHQPEI